MMKSKYYIVLVLATMLIMATAMPAMAFQRVLIPLNYYGECEVEVQFKQFTIDGAAIMPFASYNVYADKGDEQMSNGLWRAWGWTRLIDKKSGDDIFHYTKVTYYMRDGQEGVESDKEWGTGKVPAHTEETYKHTVVRVFYGIS